MIKKISLLTILFLNIYSTWAQTDSTKSNNKFTISGFIDGYYRYDFANPKNQTNNFTSFTNTQNKLTLGMASVKIDQTLGKLNATLDLGYGKRAEEFSYNDNGFMALVKQAYVSYTISDKLKISVGKWATHVGYELLDAPLNRNYSMSYGFSYGPFFHTGVKVDYALPGNSSIMFGVANQTDFVTSNSPSKVFIGQFSTKLFEEKTTIYVNYLGGNTGGENNFSQFDFVINNALSSKLSLNYDGTWYTAKTLGIKNTWKSNALYLNYDLSDKIGFTYRTELFDDKQSLTAGAFGTSIFANTLSLNYKVKKITFIPEIRNDRSKDKIYYSNNGLTSQQSTSFVIAAVYKF